jgi:hypothetical protein
MSSYPQRLQRLDAKVLPTVQQRCGEAVVRLSPTVSLNEEDVTHMPTDRVTVGPDQPERLSLAGSSHMRAIVMTWTDSQAP